MTDTWTGKCLTCGKSIEREDRSEVQSLMDAHADQLDHEISVFQDRRYSAMAGGFVEGSYTDHGETDIAYLAGKIRDAREEHELDQKDVADEVGVAIATVSNWENGVSLPQDPGTRRRLENLLDVDLGGGEGAE